MSKILEIIQSIAADSKMWFFRLGATLMLCILLFVAFGGVSHNTRWNIDHIEVSGARAVSDQSILDAVSPLLVGNYYLAYARDNSYLFPRFEIARTLLESFPRLSTVRALRVSDHVIQIIVTERQPFALWCGTEYVAIESEHGCWFIDETGFIFDRAPVFSQGVYMEIYGTIEGSKDDSPLAARVPESPFAFIYSVQRGLASEMGSVSRILMNSVGEYGFIVKESAQYSALAGVEIRMKEGMNPARAVKNLLAALIVQFPESGPVVVDEESLVERPLRYIDMRYGNKIFFGFESAE